MQQEIPHTASRNPQKRFRKIIFLLAALLCLCPFVGAPIALALGLLMAWLVGHPYPQFNHKATHWLLQASVVGLGFGMNAGSALRAGREGFLFTIVSITAVLVLGYLTGRLFKIDRKTSYLITAGTAICGGSAIAALSPVIKAGEKQISVALGTVFILNAAALLIFPAIGKHLHLSQEQFGLWCAIAIHDTSSVVGAASKYGSTALLIATTVKLARALWIIPLSLGSALLFRAKDSKIKLPFFIGLFILAMLLNSYLPPVARLAPCITLAAKAGLTLSLFLIGSGLSPKVIRAVGFKPMLQGILLWAFIATGTLLTIIYLA
ncbi:YeiH family protein [Taibaiella chishuiensis]|uniref:Putative integral membrane protein (TIGR00698 family) n=1 Tax=Taibaiella chishuiensis TaxID=1434707 RepID=A0A2P8CXB4_9BACT|nr:putative sulfate exporter family transporter [Taibaiella chishuiensis]PSK89589.1 putative integral membrane protein (TIGR00698 family) [Taibaiella chishuiensis]